jgi:RNA polymerase sigma-70 factor (ECF subfamily)
MSGADDDKEFEQVALGFMNDVYTTAAYLCRDRDEADDLLQETYLRAFRFRHGFTPGSNCRAWLLTILHNVFRNRYRERQRQPRGVELDETALLADPAAPRNDSARTPEELLLDRVLDAEIEAALQALPADYRAAVVLVDLQELTYEEAAKAMGCAIGTVRSRLSRGRRLLHQALAEFARHRGVLRDDRGSAGERGAGER